MADFAGVQIHSVDDMGADYGKWLIHGPQGSGKSTLASTLAEMGKVLYIDLNGEKGVRSFKGAQYANRIDILRPTTITKLDDIYWTLYEGEHDYSGAVIDSLTSLQKMAMRFVRRYSETVVKEIKQGASPSTLQDWGQTLDIMVDTVTFWYNLADASGKKPMHIAMTCQTKVVEDEETETVRRVPDIQKGALSSALAAPDYVLYTDVEDNLDSVGEDDAHRHVVRFGNNPDYKTKARIPPELWGKLPAVIGRKKPANLAALSRILGVGGTAVGKAPAGKK